MFDPFGVRVDEVLAGATAAGEAGFGGVWLYDHLAGSVHGRDRVLECWTTLSAIAATVPRIMVGPLVLNVANRPAGTLAVMAATLQELSGGRLLLGIGAGGAQPRTRPSRRHLGVTCRAMLAVGRRSPTRSPRSERCGEATGGRRRFSATRARPSHRRGRVRPQDGRAGRCRWRWCQPAWGTSVAGAARRGPLRPRRGGGRPRPVPGDRLGAPNPAALADLEELGVHRAVVFVGPPFEQAIAR